MLRPRMAKIGAQLEQKRFQLQLAMMLCGPKPPGPAWLHFVDGPAFGAISNVVVLVNLIAALFETLVVMWRIDSSPSTPSSSGFGTTWTSSWSVEVSWSSGSCRWTLTWRSQMRPALIDAHELALRRRELAQGHRALAVGRDPPGRRREEARDPLQAIREHIAGNSRSDAENSRWDSERLQSTAFHLDAAAG